METSERLIISPEFNRQRLYPITTNRRVYLGFKRAFDFLFSLFVLILASPFMLIVAILIKLDSRGPVFFMQDRVGVKLRFHNGELFYQRVIFRCYKFRTMVHDADQSVHKAYIQALINNDGENMAALQGGETHVRKLTHDPRITRIGRFLRKSSIDEIPQFINVLKGDMSVVGPRPAIPYEVEMYKPWHYRRLETKPGITGLWQVSARSSCDFEDIVKYDIQYVDQQSLWMDFKIMVKTPFAIISCKGAM